MSDNNINTFCLSGRVAHDITVSERRDGSKSVRMTIAGGRLEMTYDDELIQVEGVVPAGTGGLGLYSGLAPGDMISVSGPFIFRADKMTRWDTEAIDKYLAGS